MHRTENFDRLSRWALLFSIGVAVIMTIIG